MTQKLKLKIIRSADFFDGWDVEIRVKYRMPVLVLIATLIIKVGYGIILIW